MSEMSIKAAENLCDELKALIKRGPEVIPDEILAKNASKEEQIRAALRHAHLYAESIEKWAERVDMYTQEILDKIWILRTLSGVFHE